MTSFSDQHNLQAKFFTKNQKYGVPDTPFSIPSSVTTSELNSLVKSLLKDNLDVDAIEFDFLIADEFLRTTLQQHIESREITSETLLSIEYVEKLPAPTPEDFFLHDDWVSAVHASEQWILTGCYDHSLRIWSKDGEHKLTIPGHMGPVKAVSWLKNDHNDTTHTFISSAHDQTVMMWEWNSVTNSVDCIYICRGHARSVDCITSNELGNKFISGSFDKMLKLWSTEAEDDRNEETCKRLKTEHGVASKNRTPIMTLSGHKEAVSGVQWMNETEACSASWDHTIRLWDLEIGGFKTHLPGTKSFLCISYSNLNHHIVSGSSDRHVRLWDSRIAEVQNVFTSHNGWVTCVDWCKDTEYHFISGSHDTILKLWDTRSSRTPLYDMTGHEERILCCSWANRELLLSGGADNHLKIFRHGIQNK